MYILLEYTRIIKPLSQCFDTQTIVIIIHRGRDVKILLLTILLDIVFKTMKINKIHYKVSKMIFTLHKSGKSDIEIADTVGISLDKVKNLLY